MSFSKPVEAQSGYEAQIAGAAEREADQQFDLGAIFVYSGPNGGQFAPDRLLTATFRGSDWLTGGKLGPEASLLVFPVIAAMFVAFHLLHRANGKA